MPDELNPVVEWTIDYRRFFSAKIRRKLLPLIEMPADERPFRLFTTSNDVISTQVRSGGAFEPEVLGMIAAVANRHDLRNGVALDIGANIGNHAVWMAQTFVEVVAFEPNSTIAAVLNANRLLNGCENLHVIETALSDHRGSALLVARRRDHIGTLELDETGISADDALPAMVVRLDLGDEVLAGMELLDRPVSFVKIDIEGAEVAALSGLRHTLTRDHPVICFEARNAAEGEAVREELRSCGYSHFFFIHASRLNAARLLHPASWSFRKRYSLVPLDVFEDHHYAAVFAWNQDLR